MPRPTVISDEQILDAARKVFLAEGYGARTADIAVRAGVSEGSIFKRFASKEALFHAALNIPYPPAWYSLLDPAHDARSAEDQLRELSVAIVLEFAEIVPRLIAMTGGHPPGSGHDPLRDMPEPPPIRDAKALGAFLDRLIAQGRIRPCNTAHVAHALLGALSQYPMMSVMTRKDVSSDDLRLFAADLIGMLWSGLAPQIP